jgi:hypothetical protein
MTYIETTLNMSWDNIKEWFNYNHPDWNTYTVRFNIIKPRGGHLARLPDLATYGGIELEEDETWYQKIFEDEEPQDI